MPFNRSKQAGVSLANAYNALAEREPYPMPASWHITKNRRNGGITYYLSYTADGKRKQSSLHTNDYSLARRLAGERWQALQDAPAANAPQTLTEFIPLFIAARGTLAKNTILSDKSALAQFAAFIGGERKLVSITAHDCELFLSHVAAKHPSKVTAAKLYRTLRAAFGKAAEWGYLGTKPNPFAAVKKPRPPQHDADYFTPEDFSALLNAIPCDNYLTRTVHNLSITAYETGLRLDELRKLQTNAIDYDGETLHVRNAPADNARRIVEFTTKSKHNRDVPLSHNTADAIRRQLADTAANGTDAQKQSAYLFPHWNGGVFSENYLDKLFRRYRTAALPERPRLHIHSLRHSFCTRLAAAGISPVQIQKIAGHSNISVTMRYVHAALDTADVRAFLNAAPPQHEERPSLRVVEREPAADKSFNALQSPPDAGLQGTQKNKSHNIQRRKTA